MSGGRYGKEAWWQKESQLECELPSLHMASHSSGQRVWVESRAAPASEGFSSSRKCPLSQSVAQVAVPVVNSCYFPGKGWLLWCILQEPIKASQELYLCMSSFNYIKIFLLEPSGPDIFWGLILNSACGLQRSVSKSWLSLPCFCCRSTGMCKMPL